MSECDHTFDPNILIGHCDLISLILPLFLDTQLVYFHTSFRLSDYDQTFVANILIDHCDLISRFSDIALYLGNSFTHCLHMTKLLTHIVTQFHSSVILLISALNWYMFV